jgi:hypothetical protein
VSIIPIPSAILTIAGAIIYGPFEATLLSLAGILLGSFVAFLIGRTFGKKIVNFMVGKEGYLETKDGYPVLGENGYINVADTRFTVSPDGVISDENGNEVDQNATLSKGTYRMTAYLPTSDGLAQSYVYLIIK